MDTNLVGRKIGQHDLDVAAVDFEAIDFVEDALRRERVDLEGQVDVASLDRLHRPVWRKGSRQKGINRRDHGRV